MNAVTTKERKPKFEAGEWCFYEFELCQVLETLGNKITRITNGNFETEAEDLSDECFPLKMGIKKLSEAMANWKREFKQSRILHHPNLHKELVRRWIELCENIDDEEKLSELKSDMARFGRDVIIEVSKLPHFEVGGVKIFNIGATQ